MIKKLYIAFALFIFFLPSAASANQLNCDTVSRVALAVMAGRQTGVPRSETLAAMSKGIERNTAAMGFLIKVIDDAYSSPAYLGDLRMEAAKEFSAKWFGACRGVSKNR